MLLLLGRKSSRRKGTSARRSWGRCRLFRIAEMTRAKAGRGAKLGWGICIVFSNLSDHFRRVQGGQGTHVREGSLGHGQPEARPAPRRAAVPRFQPISATWNLRTELPGFRIFHEKLEIQIPVKFPNFKKWPPHFLLNHWLQMEWG